MNNPLNAMFNNGGNAMQRPGMNPQQMMQMLKQMMGSPKAAQQQVSGMLSNMSIDDYNKYILQALTQFDELYGKKEGTLTHILFNSGLSIEQLSDAIQQYNGR